MKVEKERRNKSRDMKHEKKQTKVKWNATKGED